jgi:hypothetical protein
MLLEQLPEADRARSPPGPPPTIRPPTSIRSSGGSGGVPIASVEPNGGAKSIGRATCA